MKNKGFSLIELIIVIALLGLSVGVTSDILLSVTSSYNKTQVMNEIEQQANFVSLRLTKELREATSIVEPSSVNVPGNTLTFLAGSTEVSYYLDTSDSGLYRKTVDLVGNSAVSLLTVTTGVEGVILECPGTNKDECFNLVEDNPAIVTYSFTFRKPTGSRIDATYLLEDTFVIRGTY